MLKKKQRSRIFGVVSLLVAAFAVGQSAFAERAPRLLDAYLACSTDEDCVPITVGCPACPQLNGVVNKKFAKEDFQQCTPEQTKMRTLVDCSQVVAPKASCVEGECRIPHNPVNKDSPVIR